MRKMKSILALVLAMILCLGMSVTTFAEGDPALAPEVYITKDLQIAKNTTTPSATFTFKFVPNAEASEGLQGYEGEIPAIADKEVSYDATVTDAGTDEVITLTTGNILEGLTFPHAGVYAYTVSEAATGFTNTDAETMVYDTNTYTLRIWVVNGANGPVIEGGTVEDDGAKENLTDNGKKEEGGDESLGTNDNGFRFVNTYTKKSDGADGDSITISKAVSGKYADESEDFTFTLNVAKSKYDTATTYSYVITRDNDHEKDNSEATDGKVQTANFGEDLTFTLDDGEKLVVKGIVAGASYTVTEAGVEDFTASALVDGKDYSAAKGASLTVPSTVVDENGSSAAFTNTYADSEVPPTGIIINILPFVMMIAVAALGLSLFFVSRRRRY